MASPLGQNCLAIDWLMTTTACGGGPVVVGDGPALKQRMRMALK